MSSMYTSDGHFWRNLATRILLVGFTTLIISLALSHTTESAISFTVNKPWTQSAVIAPFEFDIKKSPSVLKAQQDSAESSVAPYYDKNPNIAIQQTKRFSERYANGIDGLPKSFRNSVIAKLNAIYDQGIIEQDDYNRLMKDSNAIVRVISGKSMQRRRVKDLLTPLSAYELFFKDQQMAATKQQLQQCNINDYIVANTIYDGIRTAQERTNARSMIMTTEGKVQQGEKIVGTGDVVSPEIARRLTTYEELVLNSQSIENQHNIIIGRVIYILMLIILFTTYLHLFRGDYFSKPRSLTMVYSLITIFPVLSALMIQFSFFSVYLLPLAMVPMFIRVFLDSRTAFMAHVIMTLLCAIMVSAHYEFVIIETMTGVAAIYSLRELSKRSQMFLTALIVTITGCITLFTVQLMCSNENALLDNSVYYHIIFSGVLLLLTYPLMFLVEKLFGFTSPVTLIELSDTNKDLLRRLSEVAPGTFQHSITVGNLAAAIASKIGAKSLLVRTGALYHDIGKMENPVFFTENQAGTNPHDRMTAIESAQIIINHVTEGVRLAERNGLPDVIRDFILTHHGAGKARYFYITYKNEHPDEDIDESVFSYPGPNPFTLEQAILMMADTVEAASRSLKEYTEESITNLVNHIIDGMVAEGNFRECPITFRDIARAKQVLIEKLKSIYHTRISYPELIKTGQE